MATPSGCQRRYQPTHRQTHQQGHPSHGKPYRKKSFLSELFDD